MKSKMKSEMLLFFVWGFCFKIVAASHQYPPQYHQNYRQHSNPVYPSPQPINYGLQRVDYVQGHPDNYVLQQRDANIQTDIRSEQKQEFIYPTHQQEIVPQQHQTQVVDGQSGVIIVKHSNAPSQQTYPHERPQQYLPPSERSYESYGAPQPSWQSAPPNSVYVDENYPPQVPMQWSQNPYQPAPNDQHSSYPYVPSGYQPVQHNQYYDNSYDGQNAPNPPVQHAAQPQVASASSAASTSSASSALQHNQYYDNPYDGQNAPNPPVQHAVQPQVSSASSEASRSSALQHNQYYDNSYDGQNAPNPPVQHAAQPQSTSASSAASTSSASSALQHNQYYDNPYDGQNAPNPPVQHAAQPQVASASSAGSTSSALPHNQYYGNPYDGQNAPNSPVQHAAQPQVSSESSAASAASEAASNSETNDRTILAIKPEIKEYIVSAPQKTRYLLIHPNGTLEHVDAVDDNLLGNSQLIKYSDILNDKDYKKEVITRPHKNTLYNNHQLSSTPLPDNHNQKANGAVPVIEDNIKNYYNSRYDKPNYANHTESSIKPPLPKPVDHKNYRHNSVDKPPTKLNNNRVEQNKPTQSPPAWHNRNYYRNKNEPQKSKVTDTHNKSYDNDSLLNKEPENNYYNPLFSNLDKTNAESRSTSSTTASVEVNNNNNYYRNQNEPQKSKVKDTNNNRYDYDLPLNNYYNSDAVKTNASPSTIESVKINNYNNNNYRNHNEQPKFKVMDKNNKRYDTDKTNAESRSISSTTEINKYRNQNYDYLPSNERNNNHNPSENRYPKPSWAHNKYDGTKTPAEYTQTPASYVTEADSPNLLDEATTQALPYHFHNTSKSSDESLTYSTFAPKHSNYDRLDTKHENQLSLQESNDDTRSNIHHYPEVADLPTDNNNDAVNDTTDTSALIQQISTDTESISVAYTTDNENIIYEMKLNKTETQDTSNETVSDDDDRNSKVVTTTDNYYSSTTPNDITLSPVEKGTPLNEDNPTDKNSTSTSNKNKAELPVTIDLIAAVNPKNASDDKEVVVEFENVKHKSISNEDFWEKFNLGPDAEEYDELHIVNVKVVDSVIERNSWSYVFENGTTVEKTEEIVWEHKCDGIPREKITTTVTRYNGPENARKPGEKCEQKNSKTDRAVAPKRKP